MSKKFKELVIPIKDLKPKDRIVAHKLSHEEEFWSTFYKPVVSAIKQPLNEDRNYQLEIEIEKLHFDKDAILKILREEHKIKWK